MEETKKKIGMSNPILSGILKVDGSTENIGKYARIAAKTVYFLALTLVGVILYFLLHNYFAANFVAGTIEDGIMFYGPETILMLVSGILTLVSALICSFFRGTTPIMGSIYCISEGYFIAIISSMYAIEFSGIIFMALGLTIMIILTMLFLYVTGIVKVGKTFKTVVLTLFICSILASITFALLYVLTPTSTIVSFVINNKAIAIIGSLVGVTIASLFLISDFNAIQECIDNNLPKKYEWSAAFGLAFTVIWLYLKILNIIARFTSRD